MARGRAAAAENGRGGKGRSGKGRGRGTGGGGGEANGPQIDRVIVADTVNAEHNATIEAKWRTCLDHHILSDLPGADAMPPSDGGTQACRAKRSPQTFLWDY